MDCKYDIHTVLFRINFRMAEYTEKLLMKSMTRLRTQEWVLPTETNTERRRVGLSILVTVGDSMMSKQTMVLEGYYCGTDAKSLCEGLLKS